MMATAYAFVPRSVPIVGLTSVSGATSTPATAASTELMMNDSVITRPTLIPISAAASLSAATAVIALPYADRRRNSSSAPMMSDAATMTRISCGRMRTPPRMIGSLPNGPGNGRSSVPQIRSAALRRMMPRATVARIQVAVEPVFRARRMAAYSSSSPRKTPAIAAPSVAPRYGRCSFVSMARPTSAPTMRNSPCAKLIVREVEKVTL